MHCFSFDIETIPDVEFGRRMWNLDGLSDADVGTAMTFMQQQKTGSDFLPLHVQRVVAISVAFRTADSFRVWTLGDRDADEAEIIRRFFEGIERYSPELVSWNGSGFDLPVLHYRALKHGIQAPRYWEMGDNDRDFRYNNYLSRFHWRHLDLMDVLAGFQMRGRASLDQMAVMLGFPGKLGMSGDKVWQCWLDGGIDEIRNYCETDVLNTYLVYLRFEFMRGNLDETRLKKEYELVRSTLRSQDAPHLNEFLQAWHEDLLFMARKKREPETAVIRSATHDGRGIAEVTGKKVFVAGALEGETVRFQRRKRRRNFDEAQLLEVLDPSPQRIEPRCAVFGTCGGCSLQHVSAGFQRSIKQRAVADSLQRIGQVDPEMWLEPLFDDAQEGGWYYRRRARLAVKDVAAKGRVLVGFREAHAPYVCDMRRCEVLAKPVDSLIDPLSELIAGMSIRSRVPQIEVAVADNVTALVFRVLDPPGDEDLRALVEFSRQHEIQISLQTGGPDTVVPLDTGADPVPLQYSLPEFSVDIEFGATDFIQVNGPVNRLMVTHAIGLLDVAAEHRVLDLFCGIGNFSLPLARKASYVLGVEGEAHQVGRGRHNAALNGIKNCEFRQADLAAITGNENWLLEGWDRLLLDPARSGAQEVIAHIETIGASRIVYVSCHPGTLARDAGILVREKGYSLEAAGIIDMFPHTGHVESVAVFQKDQ